MLAQNKTNLSGQQIGNYAIEELLIDRDVSNLYLGRDTKLDQLVFIEVLQTTVKQDPDMAGSFQRRMEAVSQIKHPSIAPVVDIDINEDGYPYAIIDYIPGVWMDEQLAKWDAEEELLPVGESLALVRQIADALSVAHSAGLVDADLRPSNIILRKGDSVPILVDLGVPVTIKPREAVLTNRQSNTLDYASPEEIEGKAIGRRSNIYSVGILLYELLTGHRPRLPTSSWDIFERSTMPKEVPLEEERKGLSPETYRLVRNCLWRQEWSRFESADELITAIDTAILAEQSLPKTTIWSGRRRRWLYIAIPLVALAVLIFGLILVWSQIPTNQPEETTSGGNNSATLTGGSDSSATESEAGGVVAGEDTPEPTETLTREAPPTPVTNDNISVFNPSADQEFGSSQPIEFAWVWLTVLKDSQEFAVYVLAEDDGGEPILAGITTEPDNASLYLVETSAQELGMQAGSYLWQVRLENNQTGEMIVESAPRRILIAEDPTATPTATMPTSTPTPTASPTATEIPPTSTATEVACVPQAPFGWLTHRVLQGETPSYFSEQANVPVQEIFAANCLAPNAILSVGQVLFIPPPLATDTPTPRPTDTPSPNQDTGGGNGNGNNGGNTGGGGTSTPRPPPPTPRPGGDG